MTGEYDAAAELANLAAWIDGQLADETADRQWIAETAAFRVRDITLAMLGDAALNGRQATTVVLTAPQTACLRDMLADAIDTCSKGVGRDCADCDKDPSGLCWDHAADLARAEAYQALCRNVLGAGVTS